MRGLDVGELRVGAGAYPAQMSVGQGDRAAGERAPAPAGRSDGRRPAGDDSRAAGRQARPRGDRALARRRRGAARHRSAAAASGVLLLPRRSPVAARQEPDRRADPGVPAGGHAHDTPGRAGFPRARATPARSTGTPGTTCRRSRSTRSRWRRTSCSPATRSRWRRWPDRRGDRRGKAGCAERARRPGCRRATASPIPGTPRSRRRPKRSWPRCAAWRPGSPPRRSGRVATRVPAPPARRKRSPRR